MQIPYEVTARKDTGLYNAKIGIWLFLASEVMLFGGSISENIAYGKPGATKGEIENAATLDRLAELGCDLAQGYGISRPLPADLFERWLRTTDYRIPTRGRTASNVVALSFNDG